MASGHDFLSSSLSFLHPTHPAVLISLLSEYLYLLYSLCSQLLCHPGLHPLSPQIALPITSPPHNQTDHSNIEIGSLYLCYTFLSHSGEAPIAFRIETKCLPWSRRSDPSFLMRLTFVSECLPRDLLSHILIAIVSSHFWLTSSPEEFSPYLRPLCLCPFPSTPP